MPCRLRCMGGDGGLLTGFPARVFTWNLRLTIARNRDRKTFTEKTKQGIFDFIVFVMTDLVAYASKSIRNAPSAIHLWYKNLGFHKFHSAALTMPMLQKSGTSNNERALHKCCDSLYFRALFNGFGTARELENKTPDHFCYRRCKINVPNRPKT